MRNRMPGMDGVCHVGFHPSPWKGKGIQRVLGQQECPRALGIFQDGDKRLQGPKRRTLTSLYPGTR